MQQYGAFKFASPKSFSDWSKYAGFNRATGAVPGGVAPSGGMVGVPPLKKSGGQTLTQQMQNAGTAVQQVSQGNLGQAYNTMFGTPENVSAPVAPTAPAAATAQPEMPSVAAPVINDNFDYLSGLGAP